MANRHGKYYRLIIFSLVFCFLFAYASEVLTKNWIGREAENRFFLEEPRNSIDVLFIGSSSIYKGISPFAIWNKYGVTSVVRSTSGQSPVGLYYSLKEALETQNPKLVVLDGIVLFRDYNYQELEPYLQKYLEPKPFSSIKLEMLTEIWMHDHNFQVLGFIFPIFRYHDRWNELDKSDFIITNSAKVIDTKGQVVIKKVKPQTVPYDYMSPSDGIYPIQNHSREYYDRIIRICREKSINIVLVSLPKINWSYEKHNALWEYAENNQIPYIDMSLPEEIKRANIDLRKDFFDQSHLNKIGSQKISIALGERLLEIFPLEDHRGSPNYKDWDEKYQIYLEEFFMKNNDSMNSEDE